jgi:hypothetical protein
MLASSASPLVLAAQGLTGPDQPAEALRALDLALREQPGHKLFTVLAIDVVRKESRRMYTSAPEQYPCQGTKPLRTASDFYRRVFLAGEPRICRDRNECRAAFPDHDLIESLGCGSAVNVPVRWNGVTLGSLNLLHEEGWYGESCLPILTVYAALAVPILLPTSLNARDRTEQDDHQPT